MAISKANPEEICITCKENIFNRMKSSIYCLECADVIMHIQQTVQGRISYLRSKYKDFKITNKLTIKKK